MPDIKRIACGLLLIVLLQINMVSASSVQQVAIDDMLEVAELIFEGEVTAVESRWNQDRTAINTYVTFNIIDIIHGSFGSSSIELSFAGGSADGLTLQVAGMIYPQLGEMGIYFIEEIGATFVNPIVGWSQGHFIVEEDANGEQRMRSAERQPITEMTDDSAPVSALSEGVAAGVKTNQNTSQMSTGMSKDRFKQDLRDRLANRAVR